MFNIRNCYVTRLAIYLFRLRLMMQALSASKQIYNVSKNKDAS